MASRLLRSAILLPPAGAALVVAYAALHVRFPAADVSRLCVSIAAALLLVNLIAWVARDGHRFGREERLLAFLVFGAVVGGYYAGGQAIAEAEFDTIVHIQQRELVETTLQLSHEIAAFVDLRTRVAPPRPGPLTWERDEAAWFEFEQQTADLYAHRFSQRVRKARADFTFRSLRDRDLDAFYQSPLNAFQMRVIGERLAVLAARLQRADAAEK
jgi:hypothetical protein